MTPHAASPLSDWLAWLETLSPREIELGLDRVHTVLARLSAALPRYVLLVAGTNGKGSSVAMLSALLGAAGYRYGAYTSPHVNDYNERIAVNGEAATDRVIIEAFEAVEAARQDAPLTYFEFGTLAAVVVFAAAELDVWVLEIGMGGRLDASNAIEPTASLITNVSLDHCGWLGEDIESIAYEKAGVMRNGVPTVFAADRAPAAILEQAEARSAKLELAGRDYRYAAVDDDTWSWFAGDRRFEALRRPGLEGDFQLQNAAGVLALLFAADLGAGLDETLINEVLPAVTLTGRLQSVRKDGVEWLLDVAHNPAAAAVLAETLDARPALATWAIVGLLDDKDVEGIALSLDEHVDHWIAVAADSPRCLPAEECARRIANSTGRPCRVAASVADAMQFAQESAVDGDRILVTGSFYLVGPALRRLGLYSPPGS